MVIITCSPRSHCTCCRGLHLASWYPLQNPRDAVAGLVNQILSIPNQAQGDILRVPAIRRGLCPLVIGIAARFPGPPPARECRDSDGLCYCGPASFLVACRACRTSQGAPGFFWGSLRWPGWPAIFCLTFSNPCSVMSLRLLRQRTSFTCWPTSCRLMRFCSIRSEASWPHTVPLHPGCDHLCRRGGDTGIPAAGATPGIDLGADRIPWSL